MNVFNVGDKVRVVRKITEQDPEVWDNAWNDSAMDWYVNNGEVYEVRVVQRNGVLIDSWCFHPDSLELVASARPVLPKEQIHELLSQKIDSVEKTREVLEALGLAVLAKSCTEENYVFNRDSTRRPHVYFVLVDIPDQCEDVPQDTHLHVSKCKTMISFAESDDKRKRDIWTKMKYGRYLTKYHPELDAEAVKKAVAKFDYDHGLTTEVHYGDAEADFLRAIKDGPSESCMCGEKLSYAGHVHPAVVYAAGDIMAAWIEDGERVTARTLINRETKKFSRVYGDSDKLKKLLKDAGYEQSVGALVGCRVKKIRNDNGDGYIMCYIDAGVGAGGGSLSVSDEGDHFLTNDDNDGFDTHEAYSNNGVTSESEDDRCSCDQCGAGCNEDDLTWLESDGRSVCSHCRDTYYTYAGVSTRNGRITSYEYVADDDAIYIDCIGESVTEGILDELNVVRDESRCEYISLDDSVTCVVDEEYHHHDDCTRVGTNSGGELWIQDCEIKDSKDSGYLYEKDGDLFWHESDEVTEWKASEGEEGYDPEEYVLATIPETKIAPEPAKSNDWRDVYRWMQDQGIRFNHRGMSDETLEFDGDVKVYSIILYQTFPDNWRDTYLEAQRRGIKFSEGGEPLDFTNPPQFYQIVRQTEVQNEAAA